MAGSRLVAVGSLGDVFDFVKFCVGDHSADRLSLEVDSIDSRELLIADT